MARTGRRRRAREWVLRALYAEEVGGTSGEDALESLLTHDPPDEADLEFARRLFRLTRAEAGRHDAEIAAQLENWDLARLALIDLLLLRIALAEFEHFPDIPHRVTLNEMIELAKRYSDAETGGFINGVLDGILRRRAAADAEAAPNDSPAGGS